MLKYYYKIIQLIETILNLLMVCYLNLKYLFQKTNYPKRSFDSVQILGNGPSLKNDIPKILAKRQKSDIMVVNSFATTDLFEQLKPEYYMLFDPAFFSSHENERIKKVRESTLLALIAKTKWNMNLYIPFSGRDSQFCHRLQSSNNSIKIIYIKNIPVIGGAQKINIRLYKYNIANPLFQNVLVASIFIAIKMDFKIINLWGADHSWLPNLRVLPDNSVILADKHISQSDCNNIKLIEEDGTNKRLHTFLFQIASMFREYHLINRYADLMHVKIINRTNDSFIDAFKFKQ